MSLEEFSVMVEEYRHLSRRVKKLGDKFDELTAKAEEAGEIYLAAKLELEDLRISCIESFDRKLDEDWETVQ